MFPVVDAWMATANLFPHFEFALLVGGLFVLLIVEEMFECLFVLVVAALAKVKVAQRVFVDVPDVKVGIWLIVTLYIIKF